MSGDWESGEDDAIDVHFDKSGAGWRYQGVLGDTGKNYNLGAAYHRDENVIYFLGSDVFAGGGGGQTNPSAGQRQLYTASMDFAQIQAVSTADLASATGNDLPQALTFATISFTLCIEMAQLTVLITHQAHQPPLRHCLQHQRVSE